MRVNAVDTSSNHLINFQLLRRMIAGGLQKKHEGQKKETPYPAKGLPGIPYD